MNVLTHLSYTFTYFDADTFETTTMDAATPAPTFGDFAAIKKTNPDIKLFVSVSGWTSSNNDTYTQPIFSNVTMSSPNRQKFADKVLSFLIYYGFDGIYIDW